MAWRRSRVRAPLAPLFGHRAKHGEQHPRPTLGAMARSREFEVVRERSPNRCSKRAAVGRPSHFKWLSVMRAISVSESLTWWLAPHPAWRPNSDWPEEVGFATWESSDSYVFIDPLIRDDRDEDAWVLFDQAVFTWNRPVAVLLTAPWHERSTRAVSARYDAAVWIHPHGRARLADLPELAELPRGVEAFVPGGMNEGQVAFHIVPERSLVVAEFFLGTEAGLQVLPSPALNDPAAFAESLGQLRNQAIERVLVAHGPSVFSRGDDAINAALDAFSPEH